MLILAFLGSPDFLNFWKYALISSSFIPVLVVKKAKSVEERVEEELPMVNTVLSNSCMFVSYTWLIYRQVWLVSMTGTLEKQLDF